MNLGAQTAEQRLLHGISEPEVGVLQAGQGAQQLLARGREPIHEVLRLVGRIRRTAGLQGHRALRGGDLLIGPCDLIECLGHLVGLADALGVGLVGVFTSPALASERAVQRLARAGLTDQCLTEVQAAPRRLGQLVAGLP